jgi:GntR family histidine utilization transcriptional repressor
VLAIPDLQAEVESRGQVYGYRLLERIERGAATPEDRTLAGRGRLLELTCLHSADGAPLALEHRLIALDAAPNAARVDFARTSPGRWLLDSEPWTEAENRISALGADAPTSRWLGLKAGAACLCVERRTWRDGQGVTRVRQTFPGDRYDLVARFTAGRGERT